MEWCGANNTCVVNYNDSRTNPGCYSGLSYSTDGGSTWHASQPLCSGHGTNFGDPIVVYNQHLNMWFAGDLATGCGGQGVGLWTSPNGVTWTTGACAHNGGSDDRESMWVDNNPASPHYGRMDISLNNFAESEQIQVVHSDDGTTWSPEVNVTSTFIRDIQITGDLQGSGNVYLASMDEGGGGLTTRINKIYRSTDGGTTWNGGVNAGSCQGPGRAVSGYFATVFSTIWRHMGWGEPAANGNVVSFDYACCGQNVVCSGATDHGDVYYIRSIDAGLTFCTPVKVNTDTGTAMQWQPSLARTSAGALFASWYDQREVNGGADLNCTVGSPTQNCYRRWGRVSLDNGATWQADDMVGRALSPLPAQPDSGIPPTYEGDYDYHSSNGNTIIGGWTDGRVLINNTSQQDVFVNLVTPGFGVANSDPACNGVTNTQAVDFVMNLTDAVDPTTVQPTDFTVNGTPADSDQLSNNNFTITFHFNSSPVTLGSNTMHIPAGAFNRQSDEMANVDFTCSFCYAVLPLTVTTTNPPVGSTFTGPGDQTLDVNWNQAVDPSSVSTSDLTITGVSATVTNVQVINGNMTTEFTIHFTSIFSGTLTAEIGAGAITANGCNPNTDFTGQYNYVGSVCDSGIIQNGGFETASFPPWIIDGHVNDPVVETGNAHTGTYAAFAGGNPQQRTHCEENSNEPLGDSSFYQQFGPVPAGSTLSFWHKDCTNDSISFDWQDAYITDSNGNILQTIYHLCDTADYTNVTVNMAPYVGQTVRIKFLVHQDGFNPPGDTTGQWIDDVALNGPCGTVTPSPTPTATAGQCSWSAGPNLPTVLVRAVGVYFPDGNFYTMGGRTADTAGSDFQHVLKYSPGSNTWTQMGVTLPDNTMNNMACGVLTLGGTPEIYCVGGSAATQTTATARVFYYNPATDTVTTLTAADNWPGNSEIGRASCRERV